MIVSSLQEWKTLWPSVTQNGISKESKFTELYKKCEAMRINFEEAVQYMQREEWLYEPKPVTV